jgi:hypothetical protein
MNNYQIIKLTPFSFKSVAFKEHGINSRQYN